MSSNDTEQSSNQYERELLLVPTIQSFARKNEQLFNIDEKNFRAKEIKYQISFRQYATRKDLKL